uniref:NADH-ubiquinone oxidoreductase chain 2 n=1 Tax=Marginitermes hubbardi TaxID=2942694 RepID=A0A8X8RHI7_9NEOP|nr:NADH dehydrogenase subunit 2 [Marginitermes hubbardi]
MPNNPTKILLSTTLIGGILISISSNSWLGAWMGLEINLMSFIPLMSSQENIFTTEASLKYFIIQALASSTLMFLVMMKALINNSLMTETSLYEHAIMIPLLLKMGAAPLHWWFPSVMEGLSWNNCFIMMTVQKAAPMMLSSYLLKSNNLIMMVILMSVVVGSMGGINQLSVRKILTYSSINHTGWMLMALVGGSNTWILYFTIYFLLTLTTTTIAKTFNISFINQTMSMNSKAPIKMMMFSSLLSLGGLPPFTGFLPKWIVIQTMITNNMNFLTTVMVVTSLITLFYYLRICYSSFVVLHSEVKWTRHQNEEMSLTQSVMLTSMSTLGLMACTMIMNIN